MDQNKLVELLQSCQIPDTARVKAATAELRKNFYPHPEALLGLLHIVVSHQDANIRQLAAVQALRLVHKHWEKLEAGQKPTVRNELVQAVVREQNAKCRHSESRVIAAIACIDFENNEWLDLLPAVFQLTTSDNVGQREVGSYVIFSLLEANPTYFSDHLSKLFELFSKTVRDPQSRSVRVNTMLSIGAMLLLIDAEDDEESLNAVQELIPAMVDVLKDSVQNDDEESTKQAFEVFQSFLAYESALLSRYFKDLVQFMVDLAANTNADADVRSQALAFLTQCVRYRRMKLQAIPDMGPQLTQRALLILTELDEDDDEDDITPAKSALALIDQLASDLPPKQVIVPLLEDFAKYCKSENPGYRRAAVLALGNCAEGAPDFVSTQISSLMPAVIQLLNDPDRSVRYAALVGLMRLGEDLSDIMTDHHDAIITALVKNLEAASTDDADKKNIDIIRSVCGCLDTMSEGLGSEVMEKYAEGLISRIGHFLNHPDPKVKSAAAGALGALATSIGENFRTYLKPTMEAMSQYVMVEEGEEELALRSAVCDAMGRIAVGVGKESFSPYVMPLLVASEKALHLNNARLRETTFILWSQLSKVYEGDLGDSLDGIFKGLFESLELEEEEIELDLSEEQQGLVDEEIIAAGKKLKFKSADANDDDDDEDAMDDDDDDDSDWDDIIGVSAQALEKEVAIEVLGDVITHSKERSAQYLEKAVALIQPLTQHSYEGCRKTAISTLWRTYVCVWQVMEEHSGQKWQPGLPVKSQPPANIIQLGELVSEATLNMWLEEGDRDVVTEINRNVAATLRLCGPSILTSHKDMMEQIVSILGTIITRSHPCQQDLGDEDEDQDAVEGSSEWDWLIVDTALDVVIGLAAALGTQFAEIWKVFEKPILKLVSSQENQERSTAVGVIAECTNFMGTAVTPFTSTLLTPLLKRLSDNDKEAKSNAAYAVGLLCYHSNDEKTYLPAFAGILEKLEPMLGIRESRLLDNAAGCVSRMIMKHPDKMPIDQVLPALVELLPLQEDYEENKPVYECIQKLYVLSNPTVQQLTPQLLGVFEKVLSPPEEQLEPETRETIRNIVRVLFGAQSGMFQGHEGLLKLAGVDA